MHTVKFPRQTKQAHAGFEPGLIDSLHADQAETLAALVTAEMPQTQAEKSVCDWFRDRRVILGSIAASAVGMSSPVAQAKVESQITPITMSATGTPGLLTPFKAPYIPGKIYQSNDSSLSKIYNGIYKYCSKTLSISPAGMRLHRKNSVAKLDATPGTNYVYNVRLLNKHVKVCTNELHRKDGTSKFVRVLRYTDRHPSVDDNPVVTYTTYMTR